MMIDSLIRLVPMSPVPAGEGFDIRTGVPSAAHGGTAFSLRSTAEDMRSMVDIYRHERALGRTHPEWFAWAKAYADWLLTTAARRRIFPRELPGRNGQSAQRLRRHHLRRCTLAGAHDRGDRRKEISGIGDARCGPHLDQLRQSRRLPGRNWKRCRRQGIRHVVT